MIYLCTYPKKYIPGFSENHACINGGGGVEIIMLKSLDLMFLFKKKRIVQDNVYV